MEEETKQQISEQNIQEIFDTKQISIENFEEITDNHQISKEDIQEISSNQQLNDVESNICEPIQQVSNIGQNEIINNEYQHHEQTDKQIDKPIEHEVIGSDEQVATEIEQSQSQSVVEKDNIISLEKLNSSDNTQQLNSSIMTQNDNKLVSTHNDILDNSTEIIAIQQSNIVPKVDEIVQTTAIEKNDTQINETPKTTDSPQQNVEQSDKNNSVVDDNNNNIGRETQLSKFRKSVTVKAKNFLSLRKKTMKDQLDNFVGDDELKNNAVKVNGDVPTQKATETQSKNTENKSGCHLM